MTTDTSNLPSEAGATLVAEQTEQNKQSLLAQLSTEELLRPSCCLSQRLGRSFVGTIDYAGEKALDSALEEARRALPEVPSAYKPTGKTTTAATLSMLAVAPAVLILLLVICGAICWGWANAEASMASDHSSYGQSRMMGILSIVVDGILVVLMIVVPSFCFGTLSKWFKNRNPKLPAVLTGIIAFVVAIALFVPVWKGETLAPTHLTFLFIPIRWVLILVGGLLVPLLAAAVVHGKIASQKFCEETGRYLRRMGQVKLPFDLGENVLALLQRGEYLPAIRLPKAPEEELKQKRWTTVSLWWHPEATTAFLEMEPQFRGKSKPQKTLTTEESKDKSKDWLAFSVQLGRSQVETLAQEMALR